MISARRTLALLLPVAILATAGCLATQGDVEKLQLSVRTLQDSGRARAARADSLNARLVREMGEQLTRQFTRDFGVVGDSLRQLTATVQRLQGDVTLSMHDLRTQLATVQEGIGQSQRRIQDLRSTVESVAPTAPATAAPGKAADPAPAGAPPPGPLLDMAKGQLLKGATGAARDGFQTFLSQYPGHERAGEAQMWIADAFAQEGNPAAADSVYALVVQKYPGGFAASRSLYKRAMALNDVGRTADAIKLFQEIVDKYPRFDVHEMAVDMLKTLKKP